MTELASRFEEERPRLRALAYRMLGSTNDADDVVQETWLRLATVDADTIDNFAGFVTTIATRLCLNILSSRNRRPLVPLDHHEELDRLPALDQGPEDEAVLGDAVTVALLSVLTVLTALERVAFVLHDTFGLSFEEIAPIVDRSVPATRQLASRARRRIRTATSATSVEPVRHQAVVAAFFDAARRGDLDALVAVLAPDVVLRSDGGVTIPFASAVVHGAELVAQRAAMFANPAAIVHHTKVNGLPGAVITVDETIFSIMAFTIIAGRIASIDATADPDVLAIVDWRHP
jgi:RNA polymerase sigma-70 factor, ECF subfamily